MFIIDSKSKKVQDISYQTVQNNILKATND